MAQLYVINIIIELENILTNMYILYFYFKCTIYTHYKMYDPLAYSTTAITLIKMTKKKK